MKSKFAIFIGITGWIIFVSYIFYDYFEHGEYLFSHLFSSASNYEIFFHFLILAAPVCSTTIAVLTNERKKLLEKTLQSEKQLEHAANEWKITFDSMPHGVMLVDNKFNVLRINKYYSDIYGSSIKELLSKKCYQVFHKIDSPLEDCPVEKSLKTRQQETFEYFNSDCKKYFRINIIPINTGNSPSAEAFVHLLIDITEAKEQENKLIQSRNAFFNMLKDTDSVHKNLKELHQDLIIAFANAIDAKSHWTKGHSVGVAKYAVAIATEMGICEYDIDILHTASLLHDIGKIGTYDMILEKKDKLTEEENDQIKKHTIQGVEILKPLKGLDKVLSAIRSHHEKVDGTGYPDNLKGDKIPLLARILCVADSYDAMISERPYRSMISKNDAITEIKRCTGTQFDPQVVKTFLKLAEKNKI